MRYNCYLLSFKSFWINITFHTFLNFLGRHFLTRKSLGLKTGERFRLLFWKLVCIKMLTGQFLWEQILVSVKIPWELAQKLEAAVYRCFRYWKISKKLSSMEFAFCKAACLHWETLLGGNSIAVFVINSQKFQNN